MNYATQITFTSLLIFSTTVCHTMAHADENTQHLDAVQAKPATLKHKKNTPVNNPAVLKACLVQVLLGTLTGTVTGTGCAFVEHTLGLQNLFLRGLTWLAFIESRFRIVKQLNKKLSLEAEDSLVGETAWLADWLVYICCRHTILG
jgi:hypothetical protein